MSEGKMDQGRGWPRATAPRIGKIVAVPGPILPEHLDAPVGEAWRQMLEAHLAWCNGWARAMGEDEASMISLEAYWSEGIEDAPHLLLDVVHEEERRLVVVRCSPYHDEGGPATLTGWLSWDDGMRWEQGAAGLGSLRPVEEPRWRLEAMVMEFDTNHVMTFQEGKVVEAWREQLPTLRGSELEAKPSWDP